ncbi:MAG: hypothetical protein OEZ39_08820 [Gammaproteobacteria bacterium]|nr:hypothetical protein [Gammaproteobacteria bacterium]MDH5651966.1 hypothetical protein [Gammaproteobacteria bacterium]
MNEYRTSFQEIAELDETIRQQLVALYLAYYDGSSAQQVLSDLTSKSEVLLLYWHNQLVGFTTLQIYPYAWQDRLIRIVYSGDTIVAREHWGQQALAFAWLAHMGEIKNAHPEVPLYWFVIVKGHRTFKYLPVFSKSFYPHWSSDRSDLKPLADSLALDKFGEYYDRDSGVIVFPESLGHLKEAVAFPTKEEMQKESVQFFLKKNPGYRRGHELVCLCELEACNMKPLAKRIFDRAWHDQRLATTA